MVGLGLVVFVAVFAAGPEDLDRPAASSELLDARLSSSPARASSRCPPARGAAIAQRARRARRLAAVRRPDPGQRQARQRRRPTRINGVEPRAAARRSTGFEWLQGGSDADRPAARRSALVEEQFAKTHGIAVGERFRVRTPVGRHGARCARSASTATRRSSRASSSTLPTVPRASRRSRDPFAFFVDAPSRATTGARRRRRRTPRSSASRRRGPHRRRVPRPDRRQRRPDRLPALRAAGHEPRHLAVRHRQQPVPRRSTSARASSACCARSAPPRRQVRRDRPLRERDHRGHRRRCWAPRSGVALRLAHDAAAQGPRPRLQRPARPARRVPRPRRRRRRRRRRRAGAPRAPASTCSTRCATTEEAAMSTTSPSTPRRGGASPWGPGRVALPIVGRWLR